jgi:branched-chain amino acid transport system ATP-binding protein
VGEETHLKIRDLTITFGPVVAVRNVSLSAADGETVAVFGANGSGKTTFLKGIAGLLPAAAGRIFYRGEDMTRLPAHERAARGIRYVSDRSRVAVRMTVRENLDAGAWLLPAPRKAVALGRMLSLFPVLGEKARMPAGVLSGGERQMLILARALVGEPTLLLMDEPFLGLSREVRDRLLDVIEETLRGRATILLAEHDAEAALRLLDRLVIFRNGSVVHEGSRADAGADAKELRALLYDHFRPGRPPFKPASGQRRNGTKPLYGGDMGASDEAGSREPVTVTLPADMLDRLKEFCREYQVTPDQVVERALTEYFREGDMSH